MLKYVEREFCDGWNLRMDQLKLGEVSRSLWKRGGGRGISKYSE